MRSAPSSGFDLLRRGAEMRRGVSHVRATQCGGYVGVRLRPPPPLADYPVGAAFLMLFANNRRDAGKMALEACRAAGRKITSPDKANRAVQKDLAALGQEQLWKLAKVKDGRPRVVRA